MNECDPVLDVVFALKSTCCQMTFSRVFERERVRGGGVFGEGVGGGGVSLLFFAPLLHSETVVVRDGERRMVSSSLFVLLYAHFFFFCGETSSRC